MELLLAAAMLHRDAEAGEVRRERDRRRAVPLGVLEAVRIDDHPPPGRVPDVAVLAAPTRRRRPPGSPRARPTTTRPQPEQAIAASRRRRRSWSIGPRSPSREGRGGDRTHSSQRSDVAPASGSFSIRIAVALNSAVPDFGSVASIVRRFVATSSWKWSVMNVRPGPERRVDPDRRLHLAAPRDHADALALGQAEPLGVLRADVERLAAPQRRRVAARLDAGVVRVEAAAGRQPDREVVVELVDRRVVVDRDERHAIARDRVLPEPAVEEQLARVVLVVARPLEPAELLEPLVATSRRGPGESARTSFQASSAVAQPKSLPIRRASSQMIHRSSRASPGGSSALRTRWTRRSELVTVPSASAHAADGRQDDVGELGGRGQEDVLDDEEVEASSMRWIARFWSASDWTGFSPMT